MKRRSRGPGWLVVVLLGMCVAVGGTLALENRGQPAPPIPVSCTPPSEYLAEGRPSPCLTRGVARSSDPKVICVAGYATRIRHELTTAQWAARRRQVEQRYDLARNPGEIDHFLPLEGGGANDLGNLWPQTDFKAKDQAEGALHKAICAPGVTVAEVKRLQDEFLAKWREAS